MLATVLPKPAELARVRAQGRLALCCLDLPQVLLNGRIDRDDIVIRFLGLLFSGLRLPRQNAGLELPCVQRFTRG